MTYDELTKRQQSYIDGVRTHADACGIDITKDQYSRAELRQISMLMKGKKWIPNWITHDQSRRVSRGVFRIPEVAWPRDFTLPAASSEPELLTV